MFYKSNRLSHVFFGIEVTRGLVSSVTRYWRSWEKRDGLDVTSELLV